MANMSYCRFENTSNDLQDCVDALNDGISPVNVMRDLSQMEFTKLEYLLELAKGLVEFQDDYDEVLNERE